MDITGIFGLLGGLALFLYGMQMMSNGLEAAAGNKMKQILEKLTSNRFLGVAVGAGITAVIQSSSATTVMVVGFVNSGMMTLRQAVWIIMGANIGTTVTGLLIALDVGALAPLIAFAGVVMVVFMKNPKVHHIGQILAGLGVLFIGMDMMGAAMEPLRESETFISLMTTFSNPVIGILAGAGFTAVIQSSSASVGILQTLAGGGLIAFQNAVFVLFGMNIGTCITAVLAAIGSSTSAKRTTIIHLMFNIIGTTFFTVICLLFPLSSVIESFVPGNPEMQVANMHTVFNITTTVLLIPFGGFLAAAAEKILPERQETVMDEKRLVWMNPEYNTKNLQLGFSAVHMEQLGQEIERMLQLAKDNINCCFQAVLDGDMELVKKSEKTEDVIDFLNKEIGQYISKILISNRTGNDISSIEEYFLITGNIERIGDHAVNISGYVNTMEKDGIVFSDAAKAEIGQMQDTCQKAMELLLNKEGDTAKWLSKVAAMEQQIDDMTDAYRETHMKRMREGLCSQEGCILFSEMLTDFERIGDHALNIAQAYAKIAMRA